MTLCFTFLNKQCPHSASCEKRNVTIMADIIIDHTIFLAYIKITIRAIKANHTATFLIGKTKK